MPNCARGSSPLARGLLAGPEDEVGMPADHPRSRGVYGGSAPSTRSTPGSSPLARGLPPAGRATHMDSGIIPARAGFTQRRWGTHPAGRDHPRSRGVYHADGRRVEGLDGSSPLARGLLEIGGRGDDALRIIPARAGFTLPCGTSTGPSKDHPRSRGVYTRSPGPCASTCGSSPLARGLPSTAAGRSGRRPDHPRSRGVYMTH